MGILFRHRGSFSKTERFLQKAEKARFFEALERYGKEGVAALESATPKDTGETAASWGYEIVHGDGEAAIYWTNSHVEKGYFNVALMLQYGHGTRNGGYVQGRDYINPAIQPIFDRIAEEAWREVQGW